MFKLNVKVMELIYNFNWYNKYKFVYGTKVLINKVEKCNFSGTL